MSGASQTRRGWLTLPATARTEGALAAGAVRQHEAEVKVVNHFSNV